MEISRETIFAIGQALGIRLPPRLSLACLVRDSDVFLRQVVQCAERFRRHKFQDALKIAHVNEALHSTNQRPLYGYHHEFYPIYKPIPRAGILAADDRMLDLSTISRRPEFGYPDDESFEFHWLAIDGIQPLIHENLAQQNSDHIVSPDEIHWSVESSIVPGRRSAETSMISEAQQELFLSFFNRLKHDENIEDLLEELVNDGSLQALLPYFVRYLVDSISVNIRNPRFLLRYLAVADSLVRNPSLDLSSTFHFFISIGTTCLLNYLSNGQMEIECSLKEQSVIFLQRLMEKVTSDVIYKKVMEILTDAVFDSKTNICTKYGGVLGLFGIIGGVGREIVSSEVSGLMRLANDILRNGNVREKWYAEQLCELLRQVRNVNL
jgi:transcription initiation factor TFIID subunit 6